MAPPLLILGLDGATFSVLDPLIRAERLPHLARLAAQGLRTVAWSCTPPATLPAWTSFLTGSEPSAHGVVDMFVPRRGTTVLVPASAAMRRRSTFLAVLARQGRSVASVGVPGTYPPEPELAFSIAGFDAPGATRARRSAFVPPSLFDEVEALGGWRYAVTNEQSRDPHRHDRLVAALLADLERKERIALHLWQRRRWDVFMLHLQAGDTACHHLWHTWDKASPRHDPERHARLRDALPSVMTRIDQLVGKLIAAGPPETRVLVVSDHGFGGASARAVHVNRWLAAQGLLAFRPRHGHLAAGSRALRAVVEHMPTGLLGALASRLPRALVSRGLATLRDQNIDFANTQAFSFELDYAPSVYLHRRGHFPRGCVTAGEVEPLLQALTRSAAALVDPVSGQRIFSRIERGADPSLGGPDLFLEPAAHEGYRPSFLPSRTTGPWIRDLSPDELEAPRGAGMPGVHRREGVLLACGPGLEPQELPALTLAQAGALVYRLTETVPPTGVEPLPAWLDGVLPSGSIPRADTATVGRDETRPGALGADAERDVLVRLRSMGYLD